MGSSKKQTVGYRIFWGMHAILTGHPLDKIVRLTFDGKRGWQGENTGGRINLNAPNLFGGEKREGGVSGAIDFENGMPDQGQNDYLQGRLGSLISGFRRVSALVFRQTYWGLNPYQKPVTVRAQRIHRRGTDGVEQWNDEKAEIIGDPEFVAFETETFSMPWQFTDTVPGSFTIVGNELRNTQTDLENPGPGAQYFRELGDMRILSRMEFDVVIREAEESDPARLQVVGSDDTPWFTFNPRREFLTDSQQRASFTNVGGVGVSNPIGDGPLDVGVVYRVSIDFDVDSMSAHIEIRIKSSGTLFATDDRVINSFASAKYLWFRRDDDIGVKSVAGYSNIEFFGFISAGDMNPSHIIREINTDLDNGLGYPESDVDDSFLSAADTLFNERFGLSAFWEESDRLNELRNEVLRHIDAAHYIDRRTGKFRIKLIRPDYDPDEIPVLDESVVMRVENFSRPTTDELINTVYVRFWDAETSNENATVKADDPALVQMQGRVIAETLDFPFVTNYQLAARIAERELRARSQPFASCTVYATRAASTLNEGDPFRLVWPDLGIESIIMRVTRIAFGDGRSSRVRIQCSEDVFSLPATPIVVAPPTEWENPSQPPQPMQHRIVTEAPYYEIVQRLGQANADNQLGLNEFAGWLIATGANPGGAINATLAVDDGSGYEDVAAIDFCPFAVLDDDIGPLTSIVPIRDGVDLDAVEIGSHAQIGDELVRVDAVSATEIEIGRGVLDTVPRQHSSGEKIFFWDAFADGDETEYGASATLGVKMLPVSGSGAIELSQAAEDNITFAQRALRPYPPGNLKIMDEAYPESVSASAAMPVAWSHRDRLQQTSGVMEDTTEGDIGPEDGTTYTLQLRDPDGDTLFIEETGLAVTSIDLDTSAYTGSHLRLLLWAVRDGIESWQRHDWTMAFETDLTEHIVAFTAVGADEWEVPAGVTTADVLVVAGGGGGAADLGALGGGGAGGVVFEEDYPVSGTISLFVGAGGAGKSAGSSGSGAHGQDSTFGALTAFRGHRGGTVASGDFGSGCGGPFSSSGTPNPVGIGTPGQGHDGGIGSLNSTSANSAGGGGGGAGAVGGAAALSTGGNGGAGRDLSAVFGTSYGVSGVFGGGGGGATSATGGTAGSGGSGGGGAGGRQSATLSVCSGAHAVSNTGGGGGSGQRSSNVNATGGDGGSGIILIRYFA